MCKSADTFEPIAFADLPGWGADRHGQAFEAFCASAERLLVRVRNGFDDLGRSVSKDLINAAQKAQTLSQSGVDEETARQFFEANFIPHRRTENISPGLLTGYYEPVLNAACTRSDDYHVPLLRRPAHLVNLVSDADRGQFGDRFTHAFQTPSGTKPCPTRSEIEQGALDQFDLEFAWLNCPVDAFFLHVEGSGQLKFDNGTTLRVTYDGKNGYPYTSVGANLIERGVFEKDQISYRALEAWLKADLKRAQPVLWQNKSYIFFRPLKDDEPASALGVHEIPLAPLRSLAVDTTYHEIGTPIFVSAPELCHVDAGASGFSRLMIAHDVGSAIRGPERGDIFFGSGREAGDKAGETVHQGTFYVLKPRPATD